MPHRYIRGYGGIGRRARLRIWCPRRAGSSPVTRTKQDPNHLGSDFVLFVPAIRTGRKAEEGLILPINQKGKILSVALSLFFEHGYDGVSINDIAKAVGISKSTIFHYFANKDELFNEIFVHCQMTAARFVTEFGYQESSDCRAMIELCILFAFQYRREFIFMLDNERNLHITEESKTKGLHINQRTIDVILLAQQRGEVVPLPADILALMMSDIIRNALPFLDGGGKIDEQHKMELVCAIERFLKKES